MTLRSVDLIGSWTLSSFEVELADGRRVFPMGADALGRLMYGADGRMAATLSVAHRPRLGVSNLEAYTSATLPEKAAAFDTYLSYMGRYTVERETVIHHVEMATVPNIVGLDQRRDALLDGDRLFLHYVVDDPRGSRTNELRWHRI